MGARNEASRRLGGWHTMHVLTTPIRVTLLVVTGGELELRRRGQRQDYLSAAPGEAEVRAVSIGIFVEASEAAPVRVRFRRWAADGHARFEFVQQEE